MEECDHHSEDAKICETIINLAKSLELEIVAEGVETAQQADALKSMGCDVFQGYYYYKPMQGHDIEGLLTSKAPLI